MHQVPVALRQGPAETSQPEQGQEGIGPRERS